MTFVNLLNDSIIRIKNGQKSKRNKVNLLKSKLSINLLKVLRNEGYLRGFRINAKTIEVTLKYYKDKPAIQNIKYCSKLKDKTNLSHEQLNYIQKGKLTNSGLSTMILSTPFGILTDSECLKRRIGGKLILTIL